MIRELSASRVRDPNYSLWLANRHRPQSRTSHLVRAHAWQDPKTPNVAEHYQGDVRTLIPEGGHPRRPKGVN